MKRVIILGGLLTLLAPAGRAADSFSDWQRAERAAFDAFRGGGTTNRLPTVARTPAPAHAANATQRLPEFRAPPDGERIFFVKRKRLGDAWLGDVYSIAPDGSGLRQETRFSDGLFTTDFPELSADGRHLVFIGNYRAWQSAFYRDAFIADLASGEFWRVTGDERPVPATRTGRLNIQLTGLDAMGAAMTRLSFKGCVDFAKPDAAQGLVCPAGEKIWVKAEKQWGVGALEYVEVGEGQTTTVTLNAGDGGTVGAEYAHLSPDAQTVALSGCLGTIKFQYFSVSLWRPRGGPLLSDNFGGPAKQGGDGGAVFSPDGARIAYAVGRAGQTGLGWVPAVAPSSPPRQLVPPPALLQSAFAVMPAWAPDGQALIFMHGGMDALVPTFNLARVRVADGVIERLTAYPPGTWVGKAAYAPDGQHIVFTLHTPDQRCDLYSMPAAGGEPMALTRDGVSLNPCWGRVRIGKND